MSPTPPVPSTLPRLLNPGVLCAVLTALAFGGLTTLASLYYRDGGNALTMLLFRFGFATLGLLVLARGYLRPPASTPRFARVLAVGVAWSVGVTCYLGSVHYIEVSVAALILYTFPVGVLILSLAARELRSTAALWAVFLVAFGGLGVMLLPSVGRFHPAGLGLAFGAALLFSWTFFLGARVSRDVAPLTMAFWVTVVGFAVTAPAVYWSGALALPRSGGGWLWLAAATLLYLGGILAQFSALARIRAAEVSMVMNCEPIVSVALGAWVLGERLTPLQWLGAGAVLGALLLSRRVMRKSVAARGDGGR